MKFASVPAKAAEETIKRLRRERVMRTGGRVLREGDHVLVPIADGAPSAALRGLEIVDRDSAPREPRPKSYRELVSVPPEVRKKLPRAFDIVGDIAVMRLDDEARPHAEAIARALTEWNPSIKRVALDEGVEGEWRVRAVRPIIGAGLVAEHHENGLRFAVDLASAYFSPRLAGERLRIARLVRPGESVLDMFAGIGPFAVLIAKRVPGAEVVAVDANPAAHEMMVRNAALNKATFEPVLGRIEEVAPRLGKFDRVIMNLPRSGERFLDLAFSLLKQMGGTVHHYAVLSEEEVEARVALIEEEARKVGRRAKCSPRRLRNFAIRVWIHAIDIQVE